MDVGYLPERHVDHVGVATLPDPLAQSVDRAVAFSFEDFYAAAFPKVYAFIRCHVRTADIAQELVSRVFARLTVIATTFRSTRRRRGCSESRTRPSSTIGAWSTGGNRSASRSTKSSFVLPTGSIRR